MYIRIKNVYMPFIRERKGVNLFYKASFIAFVILSLFLYCGCQKTDKPTDPINIEVMTERTEYGNNDDINLLIIYDFRNQKSKSAKIVLESDGPVKIDGENEFYLNNVENIADKTINIKLNVTNTIDEGEIRAHMYTYDSRNNQVYYRSSCAYYYIVDTSIVFGENGIYELKVNHIDNLLHDGAISKSEHKRMLEELSREGSIINKSK